jgi:hypothetical protein
MKFEVCWKEELCMFENSITTYSPLCNPSGNIFLIERLGRVSTTPGVKYRPEYRISLLKFFMLFVIFFRRMLG